MRAISLGLNFSWLVVGVLVIEGIRLQVKGERNGQGCLMRWYPGQRVGVVVLYNAAGGAAAAERIAHLALGGGA